MTDRPTTEAGRALLDAWMEDGVWPPEPAPKGGWTPPRLYAAIEAEVRSALIDELAAAVEKMPGTDVTGRALDYPGGGSLVGRAAVLRLLEGARHGK